MNAPIVTLHPIIRRPLYDITHCLPLGSHYANVLLRAATHFPETHPRCESHSLRSHRRCQSHHGQSRTAKATAAEFRILPCAIGTTEPPLPQPGSDSIRRERCWRWSVPQRSSELATPRRNWCKITTTTRIGKRGLHIIIAIPFEAVSHLFKLLQAINERVYSCLHRARGSDFAACSDR